MNHRDTIERYYRAFRERDFETLRTILTPDFIHKSKYMEWRERDSMLAAIWPAVGRSWAADLEIFGGAPTFMVRYRHEHAPGLPQTASRMAEFIRFQGERIAEIEVYEGRVGSPADLA